jgi:hypothetical protein
MQTCPPRYRYATELELEDLGDDEAWLKEHARKPRPKRRRATQSASDEPGTFDVSRWRLPTRWRNDKRVGDSAIAKMTRGCDPGRLEELSDLLGTTKELGP